METPRMIRSLAAASDVLRALVNEVSAEEAHWSPAPGRWSLLEVMGHLLDEEREDFRLRLQIALERPQEPWPPIDPMGWVTERRYSEREWGASVDAFLAERERSLVWLGGLGVVDWDARPARGKPEGLRAGDLLVSWVAHDLFHIRQITNLRWEYLTATAAPYSTEYAGPYGD